MKSHKLPIILMAACAAFAWSSVAQAQNYPEKPIDLVVGFGAGGSTDLAARVVAGALEAHWKKPVRVINKPGGNTVPAVDEVMRAAPDGYTMLMDSQSQSSLLSVAVKTLPWKVLDRTFVATVAQTPNMIVVPMDSKFKTMADASEALKKDPGSVTWTSLGGAGSQDFMFRRWVDSLGVDIRKTRAIQLKSGAEAVTLTAGGHVSLGLSAWTGIAGAYQGKRVRLLAVAGPERYPGAPDVPTTAEAGFPKAETMYWLGVSGPPKLPPAIVKKWQEGITAILKDPEVVAKLAKVGLVPFYHDDEAMRALVSEEQETAARLWSN